MSELLMLVPFFTDPASSLEVNSISDFINHYPYFKLRGWRYPRRQNRRRQQEERKLIVLSPRASNYREIETDLQL